MTVLVDSWAWIEYFKGSAGGRQAAKHIDGDEEAIVSTINIAEVFRWVLGNYDVLHAEQKRRDMVRRCAVRDVTQAIAVEGANFRHDRGWGLGDALVYATARACDARILTGDPDFADLDAVEFIGQRRAKR